jgi:hypothetical protein
MWSFRLSHAILPAILLTTLPARVLGGDILQTNGFSSCGSAANIQVQKMNITYNRATQMVAFDVSGTSTMVQNVTATLTVTAYGEQVYQNSFDPCSAATKVDQLCPGTRDDITELNMMLIFNSSFGDLCSYWNSSDSLTICQYGSCNSIYGS